MNIKLKAKTITSKKAQKEVKALIPNARTKKKEYFGPAGYAYNIKDEKGTIIASLAHDLLNGGLILHIKDNYTITTESGNVVAQVRHINIA